MAFRVYVSGYIESETTLDDLIIYFQSKGSGGGDIDEEQCSFNNEEAVIAFDEDKDQQRVLKIKHIIGNKKITVAAESTTKKTVKETPSKNKISPKLKKDNRKPIVGEIKTVIVSGICPETTDNTLELLFENKKRSGGGDIKHFERVQPDVAHITFFSPQVASRVVKRRNIEVDGNLLQLKVKKPAITFPADKKKLFIENIDPKTSKDSLTNYVEIITKVEVVDLVFGKNNAMVTLCDEPDIDTVSKRAKKKPLEGALLKITNPPVCNSILVTGLSEDTTKDAIELKCESLKHGGGEILEVIHQKNQRRAIISFFDPNVLDTLTGKEQTLNNSTLTIRPYYPFMEDNVVEEVKSEKKTIQVNSDVMDYVSNRCDEEFSEMFGFSISKMKYDEEKEEITVSNKKEIADELENYFNQFTVKEIPVSKSLVTESKDDVQEMLATTNKTCKNMALATFNEEKQCILVTGKKKKIQKYEKDIQKELQELEKEKEVMTANLAFDPNKLMLIYALGFEEQFESERNIDMKIDLQEGVLKIEGSQEQVDAVKLKAFEEYNKVKEDYIQVNDRQEEFLESRGLHDINTALKNKGIKALVCLDKSKRGKAKVVFFKSEKLEKIEEFVSGKIFEECCTLEDESEQILDSENWMEMKNKLSNDFGIIISNVRNEEVWLIGEKIKVQQAHEKLIEFVKINTIVSESFTFDQGISKYLSKHCRDKIGLIEKTQKKHMVKLQNNKDETFTLQGTKEGVKEAKNILQSIVDGLEHCTIPIEQPGMQKYFKTETGKSSLNRIENEHKCTINVTNKRENRSMEVRSISSSIPSTIPLCTYETPEKILLKVYQADITSHQCDVIVNAANGDLQHIGGLALAMVKKGGKEIQDDCDQFLRKMGSLCPGEIYKGIPGRLPCKKIIHMVGPRWDNYNRVKHRNNLQYACEKALESAKNETIIALPAVGSGIYKVPKDVCANVMVEAATTFSSKNGEDCFLREIHFVNNDTQTAQTFLSEFRRQFSDKPKYDESRSGSHRSKSSQDEGHNQEDVVTRLNPSEEPTRPPSADRITTITQTISVVIGDLSRHKADVLVNTTSEDLQLDNNPCGRALSNEAGPLLQNECNQLGRLKVGEVAFTSGGNLFCKQVCHVVCTQYNKGQGERVLRSIIRSCLKESHSHGHRSIAFPAIGTGVLGFPHNVTAKICFEEVKEFNKNYPKSNLKDIRFIVYHQDYSSIKAFKDEERPSEWRQPSSAGPSRKEMRKPVESGERPSSTPIVNDEKNGGISVSLKNGTRIQVLGGDITEENTDVIAHLSNPNGSMDGGVAKAIIKKGGKEIGKLREKEKQVPMYSAILTKAGKLQANSIAHMAAPDRPDCNDIKKCIVNCLKEITDHNYKSISFPAIATGQLNMSPEKSAEAMLTAIVEFLQATPGSLNTVRIVIHDQGVFTRFSKAGKKILTQSPGIVRSTDVNQQATPSKQQLFLEIYAENRETIQKVKEKIDRITIYNR